VKRPSLSSSRGTPHRRWRFGFVDPRVTAPANLDLLRTDHPFRGSQALTVAGLAGRPSRLRLAHDDEFG
jgi:hypothetical protein